VYRQIAQSVRERIASGELVAGDRLEPIRVLADELGVNRDTVSLAYDQLRSEGLVAGAVGRGTFVRAAVRSEPMAVPTRLNLADPVDELLRFEGARPRFATGTGSDLVALHALIPDPALYPAEAFRRALNKVLNENGPELLLYGGAKGHPGLRDALAARLRADGLGVSADEIVLCHGASQGISLALRLFAQAGDAVAVEVPTYGNVLSSLVALGVRAEGVVMRPDGSGEQAADLDALERALARPDVKAFYTIPTFHNPLGTTTRIEHRRRLLEIAGRHGKPVIEDAFEMDLRYEGRAVPSLAALDEAGLVVQLCSFSKSLFPGVRAGAIVARGRVVEALVTLKHATDLSDSMPLQAALAELVTSGTYDRHLVKLRRELRLRRDALLAALAREMPEGTTWTRPEGGYQLWVELPDEPFELDTRDLLADAARAGVTYHPGASFLPDRSASRGMRLTVAQANASEIERGIAALGRVVRERFDQDPAARQAAAVQL
jgi:GntR family transcriptional regulator/MocR family aminotransferase